VTHDAFTAAARSKALKAQRTADSLERLRAARLRAQQARAQHAALAVQSAATAQHIAPNDTVAAIASGMRSSAITARSCSAVLS